MFELKHLRTFDSLARTNSLTKTAEELFMTDSALSHQIKELENRIGCSTFERKSIPINFSSKGRMLVQLAHQVLPLVRQTRQSLVNHGLAQLRLAVECHTCFQWLTPTINQFGQQINDTTGLPFDIHFVGDPLFASESVLLHHQADLVFTADQSDHPQLFHHSIGAFEMVLVMPNNHTLIQKTYVTAADLRDQTLLTYPVDNQKLDVFRFFLDPAQIKPAKHRKVAAANILLQMVAAAQGVAVMPQWAVKLYEQQGLVVTKRIGEQGLVRKLFGACRTEDKLDNKLNQFIELTKQHFNQLA